MSINTKLWGRTPYREDVLLLTLENSAGCKVCISTYGAALTGLEIPASDRVVDVVLGFDSLEEYMADGNYMGATIGRVAGRISNAAFELDGQKYQLDRNDGDSHLHGGKYGFNRRNWEILALNDDTKSPSLSLELHCKDGMGGYPGNVRIETTFTLSGTNLFIAHRAECDGPTPLNMTAHPYFNLNGDGRRINNHELKIFSTKSPQLDELLIPDGHILDLRGGEADFTDFTSMGNSEQDRYFIIDNEDGKSVPAAVARCKESGLELEVRTNQLGVQLYTADGVANGTRGKNGQGYGPRCGLCIEPMGYPDAVNKNEFPSVILNPGEKYYHSTEYRFRNYTAAPENN